MPADVFASQFQLTPSKRLRPPAYPLITHDPYFSVWSMSDKLTDEWPKHWTGAIMGMCGLVRIDGKTYRWCGPAPADIPAMRQEHAYLGDITRTDYVFEQSGVSLRVQFFSPVYGGKYGAPLASVSRSASFILFRATATDGRPHEVSAYLDFSGEWAVNKPEQPVRWSRAQMGDVESISIGSQEQSVLAKSGDNLRIDWGNLTLAIPHEKDQGEKTHLSVASHESSRRSFATTGRAPATDDTRMPRAANDDWPVIAGVVKLDTRGEEFTYGSGHMLLAYDDGYGIELMGKKLRPLWMVHGKTIADAIGDANKLALEERHMQARPSLPIVDSQGRPLFRRYDHLSELTTIAYRQVMAGHKIVADEDGTPLMFSKENTSNGCIATVDVIYPACPFFLYHSPEMLKAQLRPLMQYAASPRWKFPFAPHDLGTYPKANGQIYGGGEKTEKDQMPVEESGNMLIMLGALAKVEKNADFSKPYLPILAKWADYLALHGLDPANQLCTDDFAGHLARNANLSAKTVVALGAYAQLLEAAGDKAGSEKWMKTARDFAAKWQELAKDKDATVLVFGKPGTWSQKYNLVWDRVLGLGLFPQDVFDREMKLYTSKMQKYGLPLDSRKTYTKLDWTSWSACLTGRRADFDAIMGPVYTWVNETPSRVPLSDWYETTDGRTMGMHSRTVVGGLWMPLLMEKMGVGLK